MPSPANSSASDLTMPMTANFDAQYALISL
jgi:hypothetical protein